MAIKYWISTSSNSFTTAANWSDNAAPTNGDVLIFNHVGTADCTTDLSTSLTGITLIVEKSYTGKIGSISGGTATYLVLDGGTAFIGRQPAQGTPTGSTLVMVDFGSTAATVNIMDSAPSGFSTNYPPVLIKGSSLTVNHTGGRAGVAAIPGETASGTFRISRGVSTQSPSLYLGAGVTASAIVQSHGSLTNDSDNTVSDCDISGSAVYTYRGTGAHTELDLSDSAIVYYDGTGTITQLNVRGATFNGSRDPRAKTITDATVYAGSTLNINNGVPGAFTFTNPVRFPDGIDDVTFDTPPHVQFAIEEIPESSI